MGYRRAMHHTRLPLGAARLDMLDATRGLAMVWMTLFHLAFDLNQFGYWRQDFYNDPFWTWQRTLIVSLFLGCAGVGQAVAVSQGQTWRRFWRRWAQVSACALLVSLGSWLMYPQTYIYFGVLHGMAVMLLLARLTVPWGRWLWLMGTVAIAAHYIATYAMQTWATAYFIDILNSPWLNWLGLNTRKPITQDFVPVLPWLGVMWWGVALGVELKSSGPPRRIWELPVFAQPLARLGRWSLSYYMLHQPVMIGVLMVLGWIGR
jgi:uncharacterized membrane protein